MQKTPEDKQALVVSIHDVSPRTWICAQSMLTDLRNMGVEATSLLVIPNHHHSGLISQDAAFSKWLQGEVEKGHEAVVHGFYHSRANIPAEGLRKRLVTQYYTAGEGEFYDLDDEEASRRLAAAQTEFDACGIKYRGFIAPAWLLGMDAERAVRRAGFDYTTRIATVSDFRSGQVHFSRSLVWSVRAAWRRVCSLCWNAALFRNSRKNSLLRIGLHPPDWDHAAIRGQILRIVSAALAGRAAMTYEDWVARMRAVS